MKRIPFALSRLTAIAGMRATRLDTSSPQAYRISITRMAEEAGRERYSETRAALFDAVSTLSRRFVTDYVGVDRINLGKTVQAQARFDAMMKGKTREQIFSMVKTQSTKH